MSVAMNAPEMDGLRTVNTMHGDKTKARALAIIMHAAFIVLLVFGVSWQKKPEAPVMAELWSNLPALPQPKLDVTLPREVEAPPKPAPKVTPPPVPAPKAAPVPAPKPDIALRDTEKKKAAPKVEPKPEPKVEPKPEPKKREDDSAKRERDRKLAEAEKEAEAKAAAEKAVAAERAAKAAAAARENQKYISGIRGKVYARVALPADLQGNPEAEFVVSLLPGGELLNVTLRKSSGNPAYDAAVERAIRQAQPFDVPSGEQFQQYFRQFPVIFRPKG
jgi:colicin import membrane protein